MRSVVGNRLMVRDSSAINWMNNILFQLWVWLVLDLREVSLQKFSLSSCVIPQRLLVLPYTTLFVTVSALALISLFEHISDRIVLGQTFPVLCSQAMDIVETVDHLFVLIELNELLVDKVIDLVSSMM